MEYSLQSLNAAQRVQLLAERVAERRSSGMNVRAWCRGYKQANAPARQQKQACLEQQLSSTPEQTLRRSDDPGDTQNFEIMLKTLDAAVRCTLSAGTQIYGAG